MIIGQLHDVLLTDWIMLETLANQRRSSVQRVTWDRFITYRDEREERAWSWTWSFKFGHQYPVSSVTPEYLFRYQQRFFVTTVQAGLPIGEAVCGYTPTPQLKATCATSVSVRHSLSHWLSSECVRHCQGVTVNVSCVLLTVSVTEIITKLLLHLT